MSNEPTPQSDPGPAAPPDNDCPLTTAQQSRNILCFAGFWCIFYLAAPVSYVGVTHSNLLKELGNSDTVANLPHAVYQWLTAFPVVVAWLMPQPKLLRPLLVVPLVAMAVVTATMATALSMGLSSSTVTAAVIAHGAVFGASNGVLLTTLWEVLRRGVSTARRGQALGIAFGVGPLLACIGSLAQQALFSSSALAGISIGLSFPHNYLALFAAAVPLLILEVLLAASFIVPLPPAEAVGESRVAEILSGLRQFFTYRPLVMGAIAYLLVYSGGNAIFDNVSIHAKDVLGEQSAATMGVQNFLRFGFKAATGVFLGWLLTKTSPKGTLVATTTILLIAMAWVLNASGWWYLLSAGLLGAGELFGAYFPNYIATASAKSQVRANIAYLNLLGAFVGFASVLFGQISDRFGRIASFHTAAGVLVIALLLIVVALPARPVPRETRGPNEI